MNSNDIRYTYDGTFEGYLCAVLSALRSGKIPLSITDRRCNRFAEEVAGTVTFNVATNFREAQYLYSVISARSSVEVQQMAADYFLTDSNNLEINLYKMIFCALKYGACIAEDYKSEMMNGIQMAIRDLYREAQSILKELDYYQGEEAVCAMIEPRNSVLPILRHTILKRSDIDDLIIYDKRHHLLLERYSDQDMLLDISEFPLPEFRNASEVYEYLWPFVRDRRFDVRSVPGQKRSGSDIEPLWLIAS